MSVLQPLRAGLICCIRPGYYIASDKSVVYIEVAMSPSTMQCAQRCCCWHAVDLQLIRTDTPSRTTSQDPVAHHITFAPTFTHSFTPTLDSAPPLTESCDGRMAYAVCIYICTGVLQLPSDQYCTRQTRKPFHGSSALQLLSGLCCSTAWLKSSTEARLMISLAM